MIFDKEIKVLESRNQKRKDYKSKLAEEIKKNDAEIYKIRQKNVTKKIKSKVNDIYSAVYNTAQEVLDAEKKISLVNNRFSNALGKLNANYDEANFLAELKKSYDDFCSFVFSLNKSGIASINENVLLKAAKGYLIICEIYKNLDALLELYIQEEKVKKQAIEQLEKDKSKSKNDGDVWLTNDMAETQILITDLENKIADMKAKVKGSYFTSECKMETSFNEKVSLNIGIATDSDSKERNIKLDEYGRTLKIPKTAHSLDVELSEGKGNIVITYSENDREAAELYKIVECIVMKFLLCYPAYFKQVAVIHESSTGSDFAEIMGKIALCCEQKKFWFDSDGVSSNDTTINACIDAINECIVGRRTSLAGYNEIFEYNSDNTDNILSPILLIVRDIDKNGNSKNIEAIKQIAKDGERRGIFVLLIGEKTSLKVNFGDALTKNFHNHYEYCDGKLITESEEIIDCCGGYECLNGGFYGQVKLQSEKYSNTIDLLRFNKNIDERQPFDKSNYSKNLRIPIGKCGSGVKFLELTMGTGAHVVIAGKSGSGKSSLLHSIILGAAYHYSPKEVEIWLFDFKGGLEFELYNCKEQGDEKEEGLKHVKAIVRNKNKQDIYEIIKYLHSCVDERNDKMLEQGTSDINDYNKAVPDSKKLPRVIVIIDEYQETPHNCIGELEWIARQGRAYGISLILSSQKKESDFQTIIDEISHKFQFKIAPTARPVLSMENERELKSLPNIEGICVYEKEDDAVIMRSAFTKEQRELIKKINKKYSNIDYVKPLVLGKAEILTNTPVPTFKYEDDLMLLDIGERNLSHQKVNYKIDIENRKLLLLGDSARANHFEYAIAYSFSKLSDDFPGVFYLSSQNNNDEIMSKFRKKYEGNSIFFAQKPEEILEGLNKLYDIYNSRLHMSYEKKKLQPPIEIILHNFDEFQNAIETLNIDVPIHAESQFVVSEINNQTDEDIMKMLDSMDEEERSQWFNSKDIKHGKFTESQTKQEYPKWDMILQKLFNAGKDCKINLVVHFSDANTYERDSHVLFGRNSFDFKDAVILPKTPKRGDPISYQSIIDCLKIIKGNAVSEFAGLYDDRNSSSEISNRDKEINNFNYAIKIDDNVPEKYLPYEYKI